jgi:hypothetical protein
MVCRHSGSSIQPFVFRFRDTALNRPSQIWHSNLPPAADSGNCFAQRYASSLPQAEFQLICWRQRHWRDRSLLDHNLLTSPLAYLESDQANNNEHKRQPAHHAGWIAKEDNPDQKRSGRSDSCPHRISGSYGDLSLCQPEKETTERHRNYGDNNEQQSMAGGLRQFKPNRPADLK